MDGTRSGTAPGGGRRTGVGRVLALAAVLAAAPWLARPALAQRPAVIRASTYVTGPVTAFALRPDTVQAPRAPGSSRLRVQGVGLLDVRSAEGSVVRVVAGSGPPSGGRPRPGFMRVTIDYVGS